MASLTTKNGKPLVEPMEDPAEHFQQIDATEAALRDHILKQWTASTGVVEAPPAPQPPKKAGL
jgi:hypothetical protein